ncbi:MAG: Na(+)-translocating NADH-quinone reductase subunit C [Desulfotalea sp.]
MAESNLKPFYSVLILAFVCALLVSSAAVGLRGRQDANKLLDQKRNIIVAAGLYNENIPVEEAFKDIVTKIVNLQTGEYVEDINVDDFNQQMASIDPETSSKLSADSDLAGLGRLENYSLVYLSYKDDKLSQLILPVRGKGLWSTMFAYVAIGDNLTSITGVSFYQHGETPGLGGEIENPKWQSKWLGKNIYDSDGNLKFKIVKGVVLSGDDEKYEVDGLSGATFTARGVSDLMQFWFGDHGFKIYLERLENLAKIAKENTNG